MVRKSSSLFKSRILCSTGFRSGLTDGHFGMVQCFLLIHSWVLLEVCFRTLSCCSTHDL
ncbi:hypothetical protein UPYG_G00041280 [Umbra pygmaea]|uniref:Uncharacterized protein n=1 Tax=Umbra pygmaea TaxID=75934 RepID=A0ABD0YBZ6_UMBPY